MAAAVLLVSLLGIGPSASAGGPPPPPAPTTSPARANDAANIYSIGDSMSTATGTGNLGAETPANSWVTGSNGAVNSMRARLGISQVSAVTLATNGRRMQDFDDQANQLPGSAAYVVVELGGNDLCRDSVAEMTSTATYRQELRNGLAAVRSHAPNALVFIASIPDIYNLWYIRGAESPYNPNPSGRRSGLTGAHAFWDTYSVIPCQSLVDDPTNSSAGATARRLAVRQRTIDFNAVLAEECAAVLRCRFDDGNLFELSSNRVDPYANVEPGPNGYVAFGSRQFTDNDISYNLGDFSWLCPLPGVLEGGTVCGDHFHPSLQGQAKLAQSGHESSFQFGDNSFPDPTLTPQRGPDGGGVWNGPVTVDVTATDDVAVRGFEYRVHHANGTVDPWTEHIGSSFSVPVADEGTTHVEARAMDVNGNLSASEWTTVVIDADAFDALTGTVLEQGSGDPLSGIMVELHGAAAQGVLASDTTDGTGAFSFPDLHVGDDFRLNVVDGDGSHLGEWAQNAATHAAATTYGADDSPTVRLEAAHVCESGQFSDVSGSHPFAADICWLVGEQITTGYEDGTYKPSAPVSRQAMSAFLYRLAGEPPVSLPSTRSFTDVGPSHPFFEEIEWAAGEQIIGGFGDGTFKPSSPVSRQAMAAFMYRMNDPTFSPPGTPTFPDVSTNHPFYEEVEWLASTGITTGFEDGTYRPSSPVTRQSMAAFLHRLAPILTP